MVGEKREGERGGGAEDGGMDAQAAQLPPLQPAVRVLSDDERGGGDEPMLARLLSAHFQWTSSLPPPTQI